jgi:carnitine O-acetyltransferase
VRFLLNLFQGLRLLIKPNEAKPSIFQDPAYSGTCHWNLSTPQITSEYCILIQFKRLDEGYGWGEVVSDGYGIAYMVKENSLCFNVASQHLNNHVLEHYIHEAVDEMKVILEATIPIKAKL